MTASTTESKARKALTTALIAVFWIGIWEVGARMIGKEVILPSPWSVVQRWLALAAEDLFLSSVLWSVLRIFSGFMIGAVVGSLTGIVTAKLKFAKRLLSPLITVIKTTPVASFIILALMWLDKGALPVFIAFLMVYPIFQSNVEESVNRIPTELLEMAEVYRLGRAKTISKICFPSVVPYFLAACNAALGMAWKAGIAAEVLALPEKSIGRELYYSKVYIEMTDVFAWTLTVILLSLLIEKLLTSLLRFVFRTKRGLGND